MKVVLDDGCSGWPICKEPVFLVNLTIAMDWKRQDKGMLPEVDSLMFKDE